jgi:hypothetical protein
MDLVRWNEEYETTGVIKEYDDMYHEFLWKCNPNENYHKDVGYNRNHLLGILVCRACPMVSLHVLDDRIKLLPQNPIEMNLAELKDTLSNLQFEWPVFITRIKNDVSKVECVRVYVQACMYRLGRLMDCMHDDKTLNIEGDTCPGIDGLRCISPSAIRRFMASILLLNRHIDLYDISEEVPACDYTVPLSPYTHEASMEDFHIQCMYYFLPIAARMQYKHDFPGMYNNISQAVYFHDSNYKPIKRNEHTSTEPIHMLPSLKLLYPHIGVKYEDDLFNPIDASSTNTWYWILLPRRIYLVSPEPKIYYSDNLASLVRIYVEFMHVLDSPR